MHQNSVQNIPVISPVTIKRSITKDLTCEVVFDRKVDFTIDLAQKMIEMPTFEGERALRDRHVDFLVGEAKRGLFLSDISSLITCECCFGNGVVEKRLNGQHTAWMRAMMPPDWNCKIRWLKYRVTSDDDFRKLYASIDRGAPRTRGHIVAARLFGTAEFPGYTRQMLSLLQASIPVWLAETHNERCKFVVDDVANMMQGKYRDLCHKVAGFLMAHGCGTGHHLWRSAAVAAMFATYSKVSLEAADGFWKGVDDGLDLKSSNDPRYRLREFLLRAGLRTNGSKMKIAVSGDEMFNMCIYCWNAHRSGQEMKVLRSPDSRPEVK